MTRTYTGAITFNGTGGTITPNGIALASTITFNSGSGSWTLGGNFVNGSANSVTLTAGSFNASGYNVTIGTFASTNSNTRTINMGSGTWTLLDTSVIWNLQETTNLTFDASTSTILVLNNTVTAKQIYMSSTAGGPRTLNTVTLDSTTGGLVSFSMIGTINYLNVFHAGSSASISTNPTISSDIIFNNVDFTGFSGIYGNSYGGSPVFNGNVDFSQATSFAFESADGRQIFKFNGNVIFPANLPAYAWYNGALIFAGSGSHTITSNGSTINSNVTINAPSGTYILNDNLTLGTSVARIFNLTAGTLNMNNYNISSSSFTSTNSNTRTLSMGSGIYTLVGTGTVWNTSDISNLTFNAGTSTLLITNSTVSTKTISSGGPIQLNTIATHSTTAGSVSIGNVSATQLNIAHTGASASLTTTATTSVFGSINFTGYSGVLAAMSGTVSGNFDLTAATAVTAWTGAGTLTIGGSLTLPAALTNTYTGTLILNGSGAHTITTNGIVLNSIITFSGTGSYTLQDDLSNAVTRAITLTSGTLNFNNHDVTTGYFISDNTNTRTLILGSGTFTLTAINWTAWDTGDHTGFTLTAGTAIVEFDYPNQRMIFSEGGLGAGVQPLYAVSVDVAATGVTRFDGLSATTLSAAIDGTSSSLRFTGTNTISNITIPSGVTVNFDSASILNVDVMSANGATLKSQTLFEQWNIHKINAGTIAIADVTVQESIATPANTFYATGASINSFESNQGWHFCEIVSACSGSIPSNPNLTSSSSSSGGGGGGGGYGKTAINKMIETALKPYACLPGHLFNITNGAPCLTTTTPTTTVVPPIASISPFTRTLHLKDIGADVKELQKYLNTHGFPLTTSGLGSLGNETTKFGLLTHAAVMKFQIANKLTPDGIVGPRTRLVMK